MKRQRLLAWRQGLLATELVIEHREVGLGGIVPVRPTLPDPRTQGRLAGPKIQDPQRCTERSRQHRELLTPRARQEGGIDDDRNAAATHDAGEVLESFIGALGHRRVVHPGRHGAFGLRLGR